MERGGGNRFEGDERGEAALGGDGLASHDDRGATIVDARGIPGRHGAVGRECGTQAREGLEGRPGLGVLVLGDGEGLAARHLNGNDLLGEGGLGLGEGGSALRLDGEARERARDLLAGLGLGGKVGRLPRELSIGERQRVAIARALVTGPSLLLADEPTAGLDPEQSLAVLQKLETASREHGLTLVMVTHDPALLGRFDQTLAVERLTQPT